MKKLIYQFHGWLGLNFGLLLFIICLSGSFAVISHEIDWLCNPAIRVSPEGDRLKWSALLESAKKHTDNRDIRMCFAPQGSYFAAEFWTKDERGNTRRIYVNPYNGEVMGEATWMNVQRFFRDFHRRFYIMAWWGIWVVAIFSLPLLLSSITGLLFYKRWWTRLATLRLRSGKRAFFSDLHKLIGIWTLLFTFVIGATGIWYFVEIPLSWMPAKNNPPAASTPAASMPAEKIDRSKPPLSIDRLIEITESSIPEFQVRKIALPTKRSKPITISGQATAWLVRNRTNWTKIDPHSGRLIDSSKAENLDLLERWSHTADPLHFGNFAGLTSKLIWFFFGIGLSALIPTGAYLWIQRRNMRTRKKLERSVIKNRSITHKELTKKVRRHYWVGIISTLLIGYFAASATYEALEKQYYSAADKGDFQGLGEPAAIVVYSSFLVGIGLISLCWFCCVWLPSGRMLLAHSNVRLGLNKSNQSE